MASKGLGLGQVLAALVAFGKAYGTGGAAAAAAAAGCSLAGVSAADTVVLSGLAGSAGHWVSDRVNAWLAARRTKAAVEAGRAPGGVVDTSAVPGASGAPVAPYSLAIKRYCGHDGTWHWATTSVRTVGMAKGGGWWKAETMDGRVYDLDRDVFE